MHHEKESFSVKKKMRRKVVLLYWEQNKEEDVLYGCNYVVQVFRFPLCRSSAMHEYNKCVRVYICNAFWPIYTRERFASVEQLVPQGTGFHITAQ